MNLIFETSVECDTQQVKTLDTEKPFKVAPVKVFKAFKMVGVEKAPGPHSILPRLYCMCLTWRQCLAGYLPA